MYGPPPGFAPGYGPHHMPPHHLPPHHMPPPPMGPHHYPPGAGMGYGYGYGPHYSKQIIGIINYYYH